MSELIWLTQKVVVFGESIMVSLYPIKGVELIKFSYDLRDELSGKFDNINIE